MRFHIGEVGCMKSEVSNCSWLGSGVALSDVDCDNEESEPEDCTLDKDPLSAHLH